MSIFRTGSCVLLLLSSATVLAYGSRNARQLSSEFNLNNRDFVNSEFTRLTKTIRDILGDREWSVIQTDALSSIRNNDFRYFDPLVKETSCESRAVFGAHIAQQLRLGVEPSQTDKDLLTLIYILAHALNTHYGEDGFGSEDQNNRDQLATFLLSLTRKQYSNRKVDRLIADLEKAVAHGSVIFVRNLAGRFNAESLLSVLTKQVVYDDQFHRRPVASCFGVCSLELAFANISKMLFVIRTRLSSEATNTPSSGTVVAVFRHGNNGFSVVSPEELIDLDLPVLVADAVTTRFGNGRQAPPSVEDVERYIAELDFEPLWLSGAAAHPQFAGENKYAELTGSPTSEPTVSEYTSYRDTSKRIGTSTDNRSQQFVVHSYVTTLEQALRYGGRSAKLDIDPLELSNSLYYPVQLGSTQQNHQEETDNQENTQTTTTKSDIVYENPSESMNEDSEDIDLDTTKLDESRCDSVIDSSVCENIFTTQTNNSITSILRRAIPMAAIGAIYALQILNTVAKKPTWYKKQQ